jgi:Flp pilus assembly protein TadD
MLYENSKDFTKALEIYKKLAAFSSFEATASQAMGLIYEQEGKKEEARVMYEKYISLTQNEKGQPDPYQAFVQARLSRLEK